MARQFVACADTSCPLNELKQCRAPFIFVGEDGTCMIRPQGPYENKSQIENYVEIKGCSCQKCNHWEIDQVSNRGICALAADLTFDKQNRCNDYAKQIAEPGFSATV
jgi:hypothetical protein